MRKRILEEGNRADGREVTQIRQLDIHVGVLPRTHGTGLFQRGETQVLTVATLGGFCMAQKLDTLSPHESKRYMHHYNFPPYSVGEARPMRGAGRREIGHGALAERALEPVIPADDFPYAFRLVSEVMSSNGSTSMASVCGSTLALMDAGVPISAPVAGIAMGLIMGDDGNYQVLTDIAGQEDFMGDMDFKVAGTREASPPSRWTSRSAASRTNCSNSAPAGEGCARKILDSMLEVIAEPREEVSDTPRRCTASTSTRSDRDGHRPWRQDDPQDPGRGRRRHHRHRGRRHRLRRRHQRSRRAQGDRHDRRPHKEVTSARSTPAR